MVKRFQRDYGCMGLVLQWIRRDQGTEAPFYYLYYAQYIFMEEIDKDREKRKQDALIFCRNAIIFVFITSISAVLIALFVSHWDTTILESRSMVIIYVVELFIFFGAIHVAIFGWQEK